MMHGSTKLKVIYVIVIEINYLIYVLVRQMYAYFCDSTI